MPLDRRSFLSRGAVGAAGLAVFGGGASTLLAACGSSSSSGSGSGGGSEGDLGTLSYQLMWIKNTEFAGQYVADSRGYYEGFDKVDLIAGGPTVSQDAVVESGKAIVGVSDPNVTAAAINKGADLVIIGAVYQKNPFAITSRKDKNPIANPQAMIGKKIGVQATNEVIWNAFLKANDLTESQVTKVPVQFDPQPLINGEVDGWFSYFTNEPNTLRIQGVEPEVFLLADYGFPITGQNQIVKRSFLEKNREAVKAALLGDIKGWRDSVADPQLPVDLAVNVYGKDQGLDPAKELMQSKDQNTLVLTAETTTNGLCTISEALQKQVIDALALVDIPIAADKLFDMSVIEEVYAENPDLKTAPA